MAAICDINQNNIRGVIYTETINRTNRVLGCIIGLQNGKYDLYIHTYGDITRGCNSIGEPCEFIGTITTCKYGIIYLYIETNISIESMIGKSLSISKNGDVLACGVIGIGKD
ncbi:inactive Cu-Zn superoxide dismutase-like virion protein [Yokapox virus]|uniref:Inactive Cu-Zn superoxide dismutase-like virion protein n=1 Tax=Yokapox virus TaxID=1076255 RepID=G3EI42_9POXV|nr:inactive Cu-Zn superoxide dismutase-like virion protein [Yokapox virus]AEN03739.1 inactive Cu-Zn superoxide dismutase-like virion protein [Yokapox virus]